MYALVCARWLYCVFVCLSVSFDVFVRLFVCVGVVRLSVCLCICLFVFVGLCVCLFVCRCVRLFVC